MICYQLWTSRSPFQSRCRDMLTVNIKISRRETMHMSWKVHDIERFSRLKWTISSSEIISNWWAPYAPPIFGSSHHGQRPYWAPQLTTTADDFESFLVKMPWGWLVSSWHERLALQSPQFCLQSSLYMFATAGLPLCLNCLQRVSLYLALKWRAAI